MSTDKEDRRSIGRPGLYLCAAVHLNAIEKDLILSTKRTPRHGRCIIRDSKGPFKSPTQPADWTIEEIVGEAPPGSMERSHHGRLG